MTDFFFQAQINRKREEVVQMLEKQRLEEILSVCAEYERQAQANQAQKPPSTPTMQQNRCVSGQERRNFCHSQIDLHCNGQTKLFSVVINTLSLMREEKLSSQLLCWLSAKKLASNCRTGTQKLFNR